MGKLGLASLKKKRLGVGKGGNLQLLKKVLRTRWSQTSLRVVQPKEKCQLSQAAAREILSKYKKEI